MEQQAHLWAIGFDDMTGADKAREVITKLGWGTGQVGRHLVLLDMAVVVRQPDGSFTYERQPFASIGNILGCTVLGWLTGLVMAAPLTGALIGAAVGTAGSATMTSVGIDQAFVREIEGLMKPGTSALFVLDEEGNLDVILHEIQGLGGTVLKTNVDLERAKLIQATLAKEIENQSESPRA
jgi:uncharacterized membrane protein